jgi:hypothetical protein
MANLLLLPNELIQHIASFLPCSSALNLSRTNRRLQAICNDKVVFHNIAKYNLGQHLLSENGIELSETYWTDADSFLANISLHETIRTAYAAERCTKALLESGDAWTLREAKEPGTYKLSRWLPHIMALHHPAASQLKPEAFLELQGRLQMQPGPGLTMESLTLWYPPEFIDVNFILSYTLLTQLQITANGKQVKAPFDRFFSVNHVMDPPISVSNGVRTDGDAIKSLRQRVRTYGIFCKSHGYPFEMDLATALLPTLILELAVHHLKPNQMSELPSPARIPFHSLMHLPPIFDNNPAPIYGDERVAFGMCHTREMLSPEFLSSGRWMGYYSDQRRALGRRHFGPPMRNIQIVARHLTNQDSFASPTGSAVTVIDPQSRGTDSVGEFSLQGHVRHDSGFTTITKRYLTRELSWEWEANMTPFGMVGAWAGVDGIFRGYFWLWKEEWR